MSAAPDPALVVRLSIDERGGKVVVISTRSAQILTTLQEQALGPDDTDLPERLAKTCAECIPVTGAGIIVMADSGPGAMLASTDGPARIMEELQFTLGEGPCVDASRSRRPVLQPELARTGAQRWPGFTPGALAAGVRAVFAFPLQVGGIRVGVLDLYRDVEGLLNSRGLAEALAFADAATSVLLQLQARGGRDGTEAGLVELIEDRAEVHQATGMVSVQAGLGLAAALVLLRAHSYAAERPILEVSRDVVARTLRFAPEDDHHE
jgi:GAF domain